jgi:hypothetical protein
VEVGGANPGKEQAWIESINANIIRSSFFMERTIHGRGRGVKERTVISLSSKTLIIG